MQKVAAYILERTEDLQWPDARKAEGDRLRAVIEAWLKSKGASSVDGTGTYAAVDGSDASYQVTAVVDGERSWRMFELSEVTPEGRKFVTSVSVTVGHKNVVVFVTMEVGSRGDLDHAHRGRPQVPEGRPRSSCSTGRVVSRSVTLAGSFAGGGLRRW
jgi:hypothetical protein